MLVMLVHSPLLAPSSWGGVPAYLVDRGFTVAVPDLRPALTDGPPFYDRLFHTIASCAAGSDEVAVVGHSAAGPLIPGAAGAIDSRVQVAVFLDARLPHPGRSWLDTLAPERRRDLLASVVDRQLPPWHRWFPLEAIAQQLPDARMRDRFTGDLAGLPAALLDEPMPPDTWKDSTKRIYVQLSRAYVAAAQQAQADGWPVLSCDLNHLAPLTQPVQVGQVLVRCLATKLSPESPA